MDSKRPVAFLLLWVFLQSCLIVHGQQTGPVVTISVDSSSLENVLQIIRDQTEFTSFGDARWTQVSNPVSIHVTKMPLKQALDICFRNQPLYYEILRHSIGIHIRKDSLVVVTGTIINDKQEPIPGATIATKGGSRVSAMSNGSGMFSIRLSPKDTVFLISSVGYETKRVDVKGLSGIVELAARPADLENISVLPNGFQGIPRERATGSFTLVDKKTLSRRVSTNILDRLDGVASSVLFNKNTVGGTNQSVITIRGRSTIFGNPDPLVVIDNFPYSGDIMNLNPEDVESVTILKDAAAASIWGAFSGNGVIVITTKKGHYNQAPKFSLTTTLTAGAKPDLYYRPILSSSDFIDVEQFLFGKGFYSATESSPNHSALSPAVEIMIKQRDGVINDAEAQGQLNALRGQDTRRDLSQYFYQRSLNSQYALNLNGGSGKNRYYLSAGYDRNVPVQVRNDYHRISLNGNNIYNLIPDKLEFSTGFTFTASKATNNSNVNFLSRPYPYAQLAGPGGKALPVSAFYRQSYIDTVGHGQLLDWNYRPLDDLRNGDNNTSLQDYRINLKIRYSIWKGLGLEAYYQYGHGSTDQRNLQSLQIYDTRDLINTFTNLDSGTHPVPVGAIMDEKTSTYDANNVRVQLNYDRVFGSEHRVTAIAGAELRDVKMKIRTNRYYGYDANRQNGVSVNYNQSYPTFVTGTRSTIRYLDHITSTADRYLSYYANASYTYKERYILSGSARRDESNLFGVNANQRRVPLWSAGVAWDISKEYFYQIDWLPFLKLRLTDGYNGNVDRAISAYTTALINTGTNAYGAVTATINNPPNPALRWERINIVNVGLDFAGKKDPRTDKERVGGSLEYYVKSGKDLIGQVQYDPTTGNPVFTGNTANMQAHGLDMNLHSQNLVGNFSWNTFFLFSFVRDKVTNYGVKQGAVKNYLNAGSISPIVGRPLYSVYALRWEGLDPTNGDPQGWLNKQVSKDYSNILNSTDLGDLLFKGSANPTVFGSIRNDLYWKRFGMSFNIIYKLGYYFRRRSIDYGSLFGGGEGHSDYDLRWQQKGDEKKTYVPSIAFPADFNRDQFYDFSDVLIEKADHVRLQDLQVSYDLPGKAFSRLPFQNIRFYVYANNIGIIWKANHKGIDPDYVSPWPNPRTIALGLKMEF